MKSCFQYAQAFVENILSWQSLNKALYLGKPGIQIALMSDRSLHQLRFTDADTALKTEYYTRFLDRDLSARRSYKELIEETGDIRKDIYVLDILREEMKADDPRLQ